MKQDAGVNSMFCQKISVVEKKENSINACSQTRLNVRHLYLEFGPGFF